MDPTKEQMAREFTRLKEIEGERAKSRMLAGVNPPENLPGGDARDIAAQKLGMSGKREFMPEKGRNPRDLAARALAILPGEVGTSAVTIPRRLI